MFCLCGHTIQAAALHLTVILMREILTGGIDLIDLIINLNLVLCYFSKERLIFIG